MEPAELGEFLGRNFIALLLVGYGIYKGVLLAREYFGKGNKKDGNIQKKK